MNTRSIKMRIGSMRRRKSTSMRDQDRKSTEDLDLEKNMKETAITIDWKLIEHGQDKSIKILSLLLSGCNFLCASLFILSFYPFMPKFHRFIQQLLLLLFFHHWQFQKPILQPLQVFIEDIVLLLLFLFGFPCSVYCA